MEEGKAVVVEALRQDAWDAYQTFKWSREKAVETGDYKEARLAASDHLDRIGATEKPREIVPNLTIVLQGKNADAANLLAPMTEIVVEAVEEKHEAS